MRHRSTLSFAALATAGALFLAACGDDSSTAATTTAKPAATSAAPATTGAMAQKDIVDTAVAAGSFKTLAGLLTSAGLVDTLKGAGPFTVFAPTDEAFAKVDPKVLAALGKDKAALTKVLTYHVVPGKVTAADVKPGMVKTVSGDSLTLAVDGGKVMVDKATVTQPDVMASNGVIHVIDSVLLPPGLQIG